MKSTGFTLYELLITLAVIAITLTVGLPGFNKTIQTSRTKTATSELLAAIELTRTTAVFTGTRTILAANTQWHDGWNIFLDEDDDGMLDENEITILKQDKLIGVAIKGNHHMREFISFIGTGEGRVPGRANTGTLIIGTITICPTTQGAGYSITLSKGGRSRVTKMTIEQCDSAVSR